MVDGNIFGREFSVGKDFEVMRLSINWEEEYSIC